MSRPNRPGSCDEVMKQLARAKKDLENVIDLDKDKKAVKIKELKPAFRQEPNYQRSGVSKFTNSRSSFRRPKLTWKL